MSTRKELAAERRKQRQIAKERLRALRHELRDARQRASRRSSTPRSAAAPSGSPCANACARPGSRARRAPGDRTRRAAERCAPVRPRRQEARSLGKATSPASARPRRGAPRARRDAQGRPRRARATRAGPRLLTSRRETDDEVFAAIPPDLAPLFLRVKGAIKGKGRLSRTEAFLRYAESHPEEVLAVSQHPVDARVQELERRERALTREAGLKPSLRETRKAARLNRMRARADRRRSETAEETCGCATGSRTSLPRIRPPPPPPSGSPTRPRPRKLAGRRPSARLRWRTRPSAPRRRTATTRARGPPPGRRVRGRSSSRTRRTATTRALGSPARARPSKTPP